MNRIAYRLDLDFREAPIIEVIKSIINQFGVCWPSKTVHISTLHEGYNAIPDKKNLNVKLIQDGYLPPNYSSKYLKFYGRHTEFYTWDHIGRDTFLFHGLPNRIIPFRKKLYLPSPTYPQVIKKVLCVASGAGDWTAIKNRSDEDKMVFAFGRIAAMHPEIEFVYRCHPVWIQPLHQGVNSINRVIDYFDYLHLPNLRVSSNLPLDDAREGVLSFKRSSFEEDLKDVDIVFGEHSISMLDAAFKGILFCSCNVTGHRNFFKSITDIGFPHCETVEEIDHLLKVVKSVEFEESYESAVKSYNEMTNLVD